MNTPPLVCERSVSYTHLLEDITQYYTEEELGAAYEYAGDKVTELVGKTPGIVAFVPQQFIVHPDAVHFIEDNTISVKDVFAGAEWLSLIHI